MSRLSRCFIIGVCLVCMSFSSQKAAATEQATASAEIWQVRSVDTMKTSRDLAREKGRDIAYTAAIEKELIRIKELGANYVALGTPYDDEFYPYLLRWVTAARKIGLHVWFRGNWSEWEGWFEYPKDMTPQDHLRKTAEYITTHPELFADGDAFDPCPECENAGHWKQPEENAAFNEFVINQQVVLKSSFARIHREVHTNWTAIIGGRAKEVLDTPAITALDNLITIDHYVKNPQDMETYLTYFADTQKSQVLIGEFGAPIPDLNGPMTQSQQADFINSIFSVLYAHKQHVLGVNYFALSDGTTEILDDKGRTTLAYTVIRKYFMPGTIRGTVKNTLNDPVVHEPVKTVDGKNSTLTNAKGEFLLVVPAEPVDITVGGKVYTPAHYTFVIDNGDKKSITVQVAPLKQNLIYSFRLWLREFTARFRKK